MALQIIVGIVNGFSFEIQDILLVCAVETLTSRVLEFALISSFKSCLLELLFPLAIISRKIAQFLANPIALGLLIPLEIAIVFTAFISRVIGPVAYITRFLEFIVYKYNFYSMIFGFKSGNRGLQLINKDSKVLRQICECIIASQNTLASKYKLIIKMRVTL